MKKNPDLTPLQSKCADEVLAWVNRMNEAYGPSVFDKTGNEMDWGQALAREAYGPDWVVYLTTHNIIALDETVLQKALNWERGEVPDWVLYQDAPVEEYLKYSWDGIQMEKNGHDNE